MKELVPALAGTEPETDRFEGLRASPTPGSRGGTGDPEKSDTSLPGSLPSGGTDRCVLEALAA